MKVKTAITTLILVSFVGAGIIFYFLFFADKQNQNEDDNRQDPQYNQFFPTDQNGFNPADGQTINFIGADQQYTQSNNIPSFRQIFNKPTAGFVIYEKVSTTTEQTTGENSAGTKIVFATTTQYRIVERATGHVFETTTQTLDVKKITNTTIPKVYSAFFSPDGENVILNLINNKLERTPFVAKIQNPKDNESAGSLIGSFLPTNSNNTQAINASYFVFSVPVSNTKYGTVTNIYTSEFASTTKNTLISTLNLKEINITPYKNDFYVLTKPSGSTPGYFYQIEKNTNKLKKVIGDYNGLNLIQNDKYILFSQSNGGNIENKIYNKTNGEIKNVSSRTFPQEKCVISKKRENVAYCAKPNVINNGVYPDLWYLGENAMDDFIVEVNLETAEVKDLFDPLQEGKSLFDITNIALSPQEDYLVFINKRDLTMWSLDLLSID